MTDPLIVVGGGHAAGQFITSLMQARFPGPMIVVGDEPYPPYQRPPLSKKFIAGEIELDRLLLKPATFYEKAGVQLMLGRRVASIDRGRQAVLFEDGTTLSYSTLVLATGGRPRKLDCPGTDLDGVFYLRTIDDVRRIRPYFEPGRRMVILGGGYIGLELAAVAVKKGLQVTVLEKQQHVIGRGVGPIVSAFYERLHREEGVAIRTGATVSRLDGEQHVCRVVCNDWSIAADIVVIGVGAVPNVELAAGAGLTISDGVVVDEHCRTSDCKIYAIGDCTSRPHSLPGHRLRLESVHNALEQAKLAAMSICGRPLPTVEPPWFWSDQYDVKLQTVGLALDRDQTVVRGDPDKNRSFIVFYLKDGRLVAADAVNRPAEFMLAKRMVATGTRAAPLHLADPAMPLLNLC